MKYPNSNKVYVKPNTSQSNRGMSLEEDINSTNRYYLANDIAVIHKKPTPINLTHESLNNIDRLPYPLIRL